MKWDEIELGQLIDIKHGFAFKGEFFSDAGEYVLLSPRNCYETGGLKLKGSKEKYYVSDFPQEFLLEAGDMLVVMTDLVNTAPLLGGSFLIPENNRFLHNQRLGLVKFIDGGRADKSFVYYLLNNDAYRAQVRGSASGSTVRHTSPGRIKACRVRVPRDVVYQAQIGATLSGYDELIENNYKRMVLLEEAAQLLYREWFVRLRFPGYEHARITGGVPDQWERITIQSCVDQNLIGLQTGPFGTELKASDYVESGAPVINVRNIGLGTLRSDKLEFVPESVVDRLGQHVLKAGDIVFGRKGAVDRHLLVDSFQDGWIQGSDCIRLRSLSNRISTMFLSFAFRENEHKQWMLAQCSNKATMASLNQGVIGRIQFFMPLQRLVKDFDAFSSDILMQIAQLQRQSDRAAEARDLLLPRLMSGQITV